MGIALTQVSVEKYSLVRLLSCNVMSIKGERFVM